MFAAARKQVAVTEQQQRGKGAGKDDRGRTGDRVIDAIEEGLFTKYEGLTGADECGGRHAVLDIHEARADVEPTYEPVQGGLTGLEVQPGSVVDSIDAEGIAECEEIEARTEIDAARKGGGEFDAHSQSAGPEADSPRAERPKLRGYRWCALGRNRANICFFGWGDGG